MPTLIGTIVNGVVVLKDGPVPPDGTEVEVMVPAARPVETDAAGTGDDKPTGSHSWMLEFAGKLDDMPADFAAQHDHYIHGTPKR
ncbi:MAG TPA: hypothetical protein VFG68_13590 [Fimbriiglobus sp.]|nr:hypothetical protein [Fimbriiglobus sp.]